MSSFSTQTYSFDLPEALIASEPLALRDASRLLVVHRKSKTIEHRSIRDLPLLLDSSYALVANNTRVFRARLFGNRVSDPRNGPGAKVEFFMLKQVAPNTWQGLMKTGPKVREGFEFVVQGVQARVVAREETNSGALITAQFSRDPLEAGIGVVPLPPYIVSKRAKTQTMEVSPDVSARELEIYNTVYAKDAGSVASPTAGRHFTPALIEELKSRGITWNEITLHVGLGTFKPVVVDDLREHKMHAESATISSAVAQALNAEKQAGKKILSVGTTTTRTLESFFDLYSGKLVSGSKETDIFIYPESGHEWSFVDAMLTNFHLPESTLLMMVASFIGDTDWLLKIYQEAIQMHYRFYSYGDAMLIL